MASNIKEIYPYDEIIEWAKVKYGKEFNIENFGMYKDAYNTEKYGNSVNMAKVIADGGGYSPEYSKPVTPVPPVETTLSVDPTLIASLEKGQKADITATTNADNISAESDKTNIATVQVEEKVVHVTGVEVGDAVITIKAKNGEAAEKSVEVNVKVIAATQQSVEFNLNPPSGDVQMGTTKDVAIEGLTSGADFTPTSKNTDKATVQKGEGKFTITPVAEGEFTIEVEGTKTGMTSTKKTYTGNVTPAAARSRK